MIVRKPLHGIIVATINILLSYVCYSSVKLGADAQQTTMEYNA